MATCILTENLENVEPVLLSCHQGLTAQEITYDCLEKAKALAQVGFGYLAEPYSSPLPAAYLSALEDFLELGIQHCGLIGASKQLILTKA